MPTYQYACTECANTFEEFQSFSDDALTECPRCQGRLRKLFNAVGVVFKGSGFYRNDSRATTWGAEAGAKESGASDSKSESTSDSKSDSKSDSGSKKSESASASTKSDSSPSTTPAA